jgi:uncharacterized SAM-binding protein YcdF (DUF218 family)
MNWGRELERTEGLHAPEYQKKGKLLLVLLVLLVLVLLLLLLLLLMMMMMRRRRRRMLLLLLLLLLMRLDLEKLAQLEKLHWEVVVRSVEDTKAR